MTQILKHTLVRSGVFETNSSSCHTLSLSRDVNLYDTIYPNTEGLIIFEGGQFGGAPRQTIKDTKIKANYVALLLSYLSSYMTSTGRLAEFAINNYVTAYTNFHTLFKEHTGCTDVVFNFDMENWASDNYSYIDHQSVDSPGDFKILLDIQDLKDFIFNTKSVLKLDRDG